MVNRKFTLFAIAVTVLGLALAAQAGTMYVSGNVFVAIGGGHVQEYTPTGVLVQTINDGSGSAFTTGMAFDNTRNLYITNFSIGTISNLDNSGNILNTTWASGMHNPESISMSANGTFPTYVGDAGFPT